MTKAFLLTVSVLVTLSLTASIASPTCYAQQWPANFTDGSTEARLKAIYEKGAFNAKRFQGRWWPGKEAVYSAPSRNRQPNQPVRLHFDAKTGKPIDRQPPTTPRDPGNPISPDGKFKLAVRGTQLIVTDRTSGDESKISSTDGSSKPGVNFRSPSWSPDGKFIALTEVDDSEVKERAMLVPGDPSYPGVRRQKFARVGGKIPGLRVGIANTQNKSLTWLPVDSPEEGFRLGQIEWAGDDLLIERFSRFRDTREFFLASVDGKMKKIYGETNDAWAICSQGINPGLTWIEEGAAFIVVSEKDGWRHAFIYSRDGKERCVLTPGEYDIIDKAVVDEAGGWYYFYASPTNGTEKYLYRVPLDGSGKAERITPADQPGTHDYQFSGDAKFAFHTHSTFDQPPVVDLVELEGHRVIKVLESNEALQARAKKIIGRPTEFIQLKIDNDVTMDAWMIKPADFDPAKKYPVFVYVYGEPHAQTVLNRWGAAQCHFNRVIADLGYIVVSIDNRGTPCPKGAAWRRAIFGSLGPLSTKEQVAGLKAIGKKFPFVDLSRVGIWGWSGGGSNTLNALFRQPDDYHVGIAVVPKPQPHLYNAWFQEIFMRTREVNPEGYRRSAPINFAEGLKGKLLMITGSGETNTHIQIIEGLVDRLIELRKPFDYMVYPNRNHGLREGKGTQVHVRMLIARYLIENLPAGAK